MMIAALTIWMLLQGVMEGIFFDMYDHRKSYPINMHYLFGAIRVAVWLVFPTLDAAIWLVLAYPFIHDGAMYSARLWSFSRTFENDPVKPITWYGAISMEWLNNPNPTPYKGKAIFSFNWQTRLGLFVAAIAVIVFLHYQ